jgi:hypothetical protein
MYLACRHIKPNGVACNSPALRGQRFCYFHARVRTNPQSSPASTMRLPVPMDSNAILQSISIIFDGLLDSTIDNKKAAQLFWGLQIASGALPRTDRTDPKSVQSITRTRQGEELAPIRRICSSDDNCDKCEFAHNCDGYEGTEWVDIEEGDEEEEEEAEAETEAEAEAEKGNEEEAQEAEVEKSDEEEAREAEVEKSDEEQTSTPPENTEDGNNQPDS